MGPLLAAFLLYALHVGLRSIFYIAVIPGLLAFLVVLLVKENETTVSAKSKIDFSLRRFPKEYWRYLLATALFGLGNASNSFLILRTEDLGASLEQTILIYAGFNLVAALISYPLGSLSDRWGRRNILLASFLIFFTAYLGFALSRNLALIAFFFVSYGLYQGIFRVGRQGVRIGLCARRTARQRGRVVQRHGRALAACRQRRRRLVVGQVRPCSVILLWGDLRNHRLTCPARADFGLPPIGALMEARLFVAL